MTLTIGNVEQWQTDHLTAAATHATTLSGRLDQLTGTAVTDTRAMHWTGPAGAAAGTRYAIERYGSLGNVPGVVGVSNGTGYVGY
ncbi:hypothetical protein [Nocardia fusca]|uniref:WXG100 family type VII secretion target n=1 Tax=Nocardia fusca TaxID=941183 RepID=A0ABV3FID2_9NOCA